MTDAMFDALMLHALVFVAGMIAGLALAACLKMKD